eukprot:SAG31_NODE_22480_length_524_cov_1.449412_2_plen_64_part_01
MVEGKNGRPFWGTQFHPEKNVWEQVIQVPDGGTWPTAQVPYQHIAHSLEAVSMAQFLANWFVRQ